LFFLCVGTLRLQAMSLMCAGGPAWFDQTVLGQTEQHLPPKR
jgi:hypothetical protein